MITRFNTVFIIVFWCFASMAQAPQKIKYQGIARNLSGNPLVNQNISLKISMLEGSISGPAVFAETFFTSTNAFGLFNILIGTGTVVSGSFAGIDWGHNDYFQQVEMDTSGGNSYTLVGTSQLVSVPYALYAESSGNCGFTNMQVFYATDTFTIPDNVKKIMVEVWGGGGGGGFSIPYQGKQNGGGGGGYGKEIFNVIPGTVYNITMGYGGLGSTGNGGDGGTTSFGSLISADGGGGGHANGGYGGSSSAAFNIMGQDGFQVTGGFSTGGYSPNGGTGGLAGFPGRTPGGGGGSGYNIGQPVSGGAGGHGRVVVWW